jgi:hypothetical protein
MSEPVQGFLASISIDGNVITGSVENFNLDRTKNVLNKATMNGSPVGKKIPGSQTGTLSSDGLIDQANMTLLEASWAKETEVAFVLTNEEGATTDMVWSGNVVLGDLSLNVVSTDVWRFSLSAETSGVVAVVDYVV